MIEGHLGKGRTRRPAPGFDPGSTPGARLGPDPNVIGFRRFFTEVRSTRVKGFRYHIIESDSGPGPYTAGARPTPAANDTGPLAAAGEDTAPGTCWRLK